MEGDNWEQSQDSREYGPVPLALIEGIVLCRVRRQRGVAWGRWGVWPVGPRLTPLALHPPRRLPSDMALDERRTCSTQAPREQ